jgi:hypothetical protein
VTATPSSSDHHRLARSYRGLVPSP